MAVPIARTADGNAVMLVDVVPLVGVDRPIVTLNRVAAWLIEQGFTQVDQGCNPIFARGIVQSIFGPEHEILIDVGEMEDEVVSLCCRFALPKSARPALEDWASFMVSICGEFGVRLASQGIEPCGEFEFVAAVQGSKNYQEFAASFGWESPA